MLRYKLLDVFTDTPLSGNPLAVFTNADHLSREQMQRIAAELNLSETVFITAADTAAGRYGIRIMTPTTELPFAGHPTIGTAVALACGESASAARNIELVESVGPVSVRVDPAGTRAGRAWFTAPRLPEPVDNPVERSVAAALLGLDAGQLEERNARSGSAGVPFLFVPVLSPEALAATRLDHGVWESHLAASPAPHVYAYCVTALDPLEIHARMFAPAMGIVEDPATGAAAVAFALELVQLLGWRKGELAAIIHQGEAMGRPPRLELGIAVSSGAVSRVTLGGHAVIVGEGTFHL